MLVVVQTSAVWNQRQCYSIVMWLGKKRFNPKTRLYFSQLFSKFIDAKPKLTPKLTKNVRLACLRSGRASVNPLTPFHRVNLPFELSPMTAIVCVHNFMGKRFWKLGVWGKLHWKTNFYFNYVFIILKCMYWTCSQLDNSCPSNVTNTFYVLYFAFDNLVQRALSNLYYPYIQHSPTITNVIKVFFLNV